MNRVRNILSHMGEKAELNLEVCQKAKELQDIHTMFTLPLSKLRQIQLYFLGEMLEGLRDTESSTIQQLPSYVFKQSTDHISGQYYALDLGGTSFRIWCISIQNGKIVDKNETRVDIPKEHMTGTAEGLFGFIAGKCKEVLSDSVGDLGFTFSFPINQVSIDSGTLSKWTKGFSTSGVVGKDIVELLKGEFDKADVKLNIVALCNDTVGTLVAEYFNDSSSSVGVILGTGSNACYWERAGNITKYINENPGEDPDQYMCINMEWADFDTNEPHQCLPVTRFDKIIDFYSEHPGSHVMEKMMSGLYIGETVRLLFLYLSSKGVLPKLDGIEKSESFVSENLSFFLSDTSSNLEDIKSFLLERFNLSTDLFERKTMKDLCELVAIRAARLAATGISTIVAKMGVEGNTTVSIDGSVYEYVPGFRKHLEDCLEELFEGWATTNIRVVLTKGGSGIGAGLIAALVSAKN